MELDYTHETSHITSHETFYDHAELHAWAQSGPGYAPPSALPASYSPPYDPSYNPYPDHGFPQQPPLAVTSGPSDFPNWPDNDFTYMQPSSSFFTPNLSDTYPPMSTGWPGGAFPENQPPAKKSKFGQISKIASAAVPAIGYVDDKFGGFDGLKDSAESTWDKDFGGAGSVASQDFNDVRQDFSGFEQNVENPFGGFEQRAEGFVDNALDPFANSPGVTMLGAVDQSFPF